MSIDPRHQGAADEGTNDASQGEESLSAGDGYRHHPALAKAGRSEDGQRQATRYAGRRVEGKNPGGVGRGTEICRGCKGGRSEREGRAGGCAGAAMTNRPEDRRRGVGPGGGPTAAALPTTRPAPSVRCP